MVVEVTIQSKGDKIINFSDIIQDKMRYGTYDNSFKLNENKIGESVVVFDSEKICRGHEISIKDRLITLTLVLPTNENDIIFFYHHIKTICYLCKTNEFIRDGSSVTVDQIGTFIKSDRKTSILALEDMAKKLSSNEFQNMYIYGAINPVAFGKKEIEMIGCDLQKFGNYMDELQRLDVYYAKATIYSRQDKSLFGAYTLGENVTSVFPLNPQPLLIKEKISQFFVGFVFDNEMKGAIPYKDFIENVDTSQKYDAVHFIITLNRKEMENLLEKFKAII